MVREGADGIIGNCLGPARARHWYCLSLLSGPLAQLAEQQTLNLRVLGSIPRRLTSLRSQFSRRLSAGAVAARRVGGPARSAARLRLASQVLCGSEKLQPTPVRRIAEITTPLSRTRRL